RLTLLVHEVALVVDRHEPGLRTDEQVLDVVVILALVRGAVDLGAGVGVAMHAVGTPDALSGDYGADNGIAGGERQPVRRASMAVLPSGVRPCHARVCEAVRRVPGRGRGIRDCRGGTDASGIEGRA